MKWNGQKIKDLLERRKVTITSLAGSIHVTRQTVHNWVNGSLPKGQDLLRLCDFFRVGAEEFFGEQESSVTLIAHRTHRKAASTPKKMEEARNLASEYVAFFHDAKPLGIVSSLLDISTDTEYIRKLALQIREFSGIESAMPMTYEAAFKLLRKLGIFAIFQDFPSDMKSYAFFCKIEHNRVVMINSATHVVDLIFQLLHETIHAIRSENAPRNPSPDEESVCDAVACFAQFPKEYVMKVAGEIEGASAKGAIQTLQAFAVKNGHSMHGLARAFEAHDIKKLPKDINIYPAEKDLRERTPTIGRILFGKAEPRDFLHRLKRLSPYFAEELKRQAGSMSDRKLALLIGLPSGIDARLIREEFMKS